jgi:pseudaminic acid cytidylyltransferase
MIKEKSLIGNLCVIPARGGSKRIPKKNIKPFFGKPLIAYSIENALKSNLFDDVIVSTDSDEIAKVALKYGAKVHMRPKELADDYTGTGAVVNYVVKELGKKGLRYDYICTLYATAPLLDVKYLIQGYEELKNSNACNSFSVTSMPFPIQRTFKIKNNRCEMFFPEFFNSRSQDLEEAYQDAGQFYWKKSNCKSDDIFFGKDSIPIVIPRYLVQDIDTPEDWEMAEKLYQLAYPNKLSPN